MTIQIQTVKTHKNAELLRDKKGFCPVACIFRKTQTITVINIDRIGEKISEIATQCYKELFGKYKTNPNFIISMPINSSISFAIASLAGVLPAKDEFDLSGLAEALNIIAVDPIGINLLEKNQGEILLAWNRKFKNRKRITPIEAVNAWVELTDRSEASLAFIEESVSIEKERLNSIEQEKANCGEQRKRVLIVKNPKMLGFAEWYGRNETESGLTIEGWETPVIISWKDNSDTITLGCPNENVAEEIFGPGGLVTLGACIFGHIARDREETSHLGVIEKVRMKKNVIQGDIDLLFTLVQTTIERPVRGGNTIIIND